MLRHFGAEIFSSDKAQILRPPGAYKPYVTKGAKAAPKVGAFRRRRQAEKDQAKKVVWGYMVK
jgi:hypothetical protein